MNPASTGLLTRSEGDRRRLRPSPRDAGRPVPGLSLGSPDRSSKKPSRLATAAGADAAPEPGGTPFPPSDEAFAALVRPHLPEILRVARNQLGCEHLAWEAVQEALLSLWGLRVPPPNPKAWLIRAVLFRSLHLGRLIRRRLKHERRSGLSRTEAADDVPPARSLIAEETRRAVRAALEDLSEKHREVATLHLIEGLTYRAIARRLGVPIGTVRSRLSRAREALFVRLASTRDESPWTP